jgi:tetratricopeptide (TPR) repeat protein
VPVRERLPQWIALWWRELSAAFALVLAVAWTYRAVAGFDFIQFDDTVYVLENPIVAGGLTRAGLAAALTTFHTGNWIPLAWLSHMLDVQFFGIASGPHHLVNVAIHALNAVLLFGVLRVATGARWPSAFVAAAFALHPTRVESVAWISQRKELLATAFALASAAFYVRWVRSARARDRAAALVAYLLALACKPIAVALPFLFLLLDVWPLGRTPLAAPAAGPPRAPGSRAVLTEKVPLFAAAALSCAVTFFAQWSEGAVRDLARYPLGVRIATPLVAYPTYLANAVWPAQLSVFYPHPRAFAMWQIACGALIVLTATAAALAVARRLPAVAVGWFWFVGWLVPVIGLVQIGGAWRADRYTYFAFVGLFVAAAFGAAALVQRHARARAPVAVIAIGLLAAWQVATERQLAHWRDTRTLFEHALAVDPNNAMAHASLAVFAGKQRRFDDALAHYEQLFRLSRDFESMRYDRGQLLLELGRAEEARDDLARAVQEQPRDPETRFALARALEQLGDPDEAAAQYQEGLALERQTTK